jgi:diguanylate cyclase (GGDEF)-like protein
MNASHVRDFLSKLASTRPGLSWYFAIALAPGFLIGLVLSYAIFQSEQRTLEQGSQQTARALLRAIDGELIKDQSVTVALSKSDSLLTHDLTTFYRQATEVIGAVGAGAHFVLSDPQGQQLLNTSRPLTDTLPRHGNPEQVSLVAQTGRPVISNLFIGAVLNRPLVSIDVPVIHSGKPAYVLSIGLLSEQFNNLLAGQELPEGWIAAVLDAQDTVVARNLNPQEMVTRKMTQDVRQQIANHSHGTIASHSLEGVPTFLAYEKSGLTGWTVVVSVARSVLYRDLYRLLGLVVLSLLASLGSGAALTWLFGRHVRRALKALGTAADAAAMGAPDALAPTSSGVREIDQLAAQFNTMRSAQRKLEAKIRHLAFHDPLTSLANRRLLLDHLTQAVASNKRTHCRGALMFLDLDNFKSLNDSQGHAAGDLLLMEAADRLKHSVREMDTLARFGGDEFVVLLTELDSDEPSAKAGALQIAEKIRARLAEPYLLTLDAECPQARVVEHRCSASIGVTLFSAQESDSHDILQRADAAMYQAKSRGRNKVYLAE